jgi:hypothetical protein
MFGKGGGGVILDAFFTENWSAIEALTLRQSQIDNARENQFRIAHDLVGTPY